MSALRAASRRGDYAVFVLCAALGCLPAVRLFLWKLAESNLFLLERDYFDETFLTLGGPLDYFSHALASFLASPWTAMPGIALMWYVLTRLMRRLSGLDDAAWSWLNLLPGALALALTAHMGFGIWGTTVPDLVFQVMLGLLAVLACYRLTAGRRAVLALLLTPVLYAACDAWAFLFAFAVLARAATDRRPSGAPLSLLGAAAPLALLAVMPYALVRCGFLTLSPADAYARHALWGKGGDATWNMLVVAIPAVTLLLLFLKQIGPLPRKLSVGLPLALLCLAALVITAPRHPQLGTLLAMEKAAKEARWEDLLSLGKSDPQPHRMMTAYRILALFKTGRVADDLFNYPVPASHTASSAATRWFNGPLLYYEYGLPLIARKALIGDVGDFGLSAERLRLLGMLSCVTSEFKAARAYFERLSRQPFYRREAERWLRIMRGEEPAPTDFGHIYSAYLAFKKQNPRLAMAAHKGLEEDIYGAYQKLRDCSPDLAVFVLCVALLERDLERLEANPHILEEAMRSHELPMALQEGLLSCLVMKLGPEKRDAFDYAARGITRQTLERWNAFLALKDKWASDPKRQREALREAFGSTYWYYYGFTP